MDISIWKKNINAIKEVLSSKNPQNSQLFESRALQLEESMLNTHDSILSLLHSINHEKRYLVTSHDAFNYFTRSYLKNDDEQAFDDWKKRFQAPEGLAPEGQISVLDLQNIIDHMKRYGINVLFAESNVSLDSIKKIVDAGAKQGLQLCIAKEALYGDAMGNLDQKAGTYLGMMQSNANVIYTNLKENRGCHSDEE
jgi:manganese/zinc/iron transport system substrate-binding protein